jgi:hypothetical protein
MRFQRGLHYPHPPRGPARKPYRMSEAALRQRRRNLKRTRIRSDRETAIIKRLIWQACSDCGERPSQRALARQLGVWPSYISKVQRKVQGEGMDALLANGGRVTLHDLEEARSFTAKLRAQEPGLLAPAFATQGDARTPDENIAATWGGVNDWKRKNLWRSDTRRRIRVPIPF